MKTNILSDGELLDLLENGTFSFDEWIDLDSDDGIFDADFDDSDQAQPVSRVVYHPLHFGIRNNSCGASLSNHIS